MTKEEILVMEAGRELDTLVAEEIFGMRVYRNPHDWQTYLPRGNAQRLKKYSTTASAAWLVWLAVTKDHPEDWAIYSDSNSEVTVEHYPDDYKGNRESWCGDFRVDGLFPEVMCKAALLAVLSMKLPEKLSE